jgi:hypothetical protein
VNTQNPGSLNKVFSMADYDLLGGRFVANDVSFIGWDFARIMPVADSITSIPSRFFTA